MKTSLLLKLFPRRWRERYGAELQSLAGDRVGLTAALDLVREAVRQRFDTTGKRACPNCRADVGQQAWIQFLLRTEVMGGSPVLPCAQCGTFLRISDGRRIDRLCGSACLLLAIAGNYIWGTSPLFRVLTLAASVVLLIVGTIAGRSSRLEIVAIDYGR